VSDGYAVLMADLLAMSRTFTRESQTLSTAAGAAGVSAPDGGDATVNAALAAALQAARLTTGQLSAVIAGHGTKLDGAYRQYREAEESNVQLCQQLTSLITGK
jgi:3-oxoacyl-(acyl-carrier-protein) synthase